MEQTTQTIPRMGHWTVDKDDNRTWDRVRFICSACGEWQTYGKTKYCPECGAVMSGYECCISNEPQSEDKKGGKRMTKKEAAHIVDVAFGIPQAVRRAGEDRTYHEEEIREAKEMALKALEQEPCDDCIRREDALMALTGEYTDSPIEILPKAIKRINALPPVNPAEKVGKWKRISMDKYSEHAKYWYRCDRCGEDNLGNTNYCPNCGQRKVQEVEE